ncbi:MAG: hypothetical protein D6704_05435, partial [Nitrospirae bacterium]
MKRHPILLITSISVTLMFFGGALKSWGYYEVIDIVNGGTIQGHVTLVGRVPEPRAYNLIIFPDPEYCGRISNGEGWRLLHDFKVAENGGLQDVVVLLEGVQAGKPFSLSIPRIDREKG